MYRKVSKEFTERELDGEVVILDQSTGEVHQLNAVAACIWKGLDDFSAYDDLVQLVTDSFDINTDTAQEDVKQFLDELSLRNLVEQI